MLSPLYVAVIVSVPTGKVVAVQVAVLSAASTIVTVVVPQLAAAPLQVTVPVTFGVTTRPARRTSPFGALIAAVNVTDCPHTDGFVLDVTVVVVPPFVTTCPPLNVPVLVVKSLSPEYTAVTGCVPTVNVEVLDEVAEPDTSVTGDPKAPPSTMNCTVPLGAPAPGATGATAAVNVTAEP